MRTMKLLAILAAAAAAARPGPAAEATVSGPFEHRNLQIFLLHGDDALGHRRYLALHEAMARGVVIVEETSRVSELAVENTSRDETVFLQAGDILKGGRQDRVVRYDILLPPRSGRVPLDAFCVEHGRWQPRGREDVRAFSASPGMLPSKKLRIAAKAAGDQSAVWSAVEAQQADLNRSLSEAAGRPVDVRRAESATSLQLSLEDKELDRLKREYLDALRDIIDGRRDVIGFVYAIRGELNTADVYNSRPLFRALWPKLLEAAVVEAIAEGPDRRGRRLTAEDLPPFFAGAVAGSRSTRTIWRSTVLRTYTSHDAFLYETLDVDAGETWLHKNFVSRGGDDGIVVPLDPRPRPVR